MRDTLGGDFPLFFFMAVNKPTYGGQALIEGVMIRGVNVVTMAVRHPTGDIVQRVDTLTIASKNKARQIPFVRGVLILWEMLTIGTKALLWSASVASENEEGESEISGPALWGTMALSLVFGISLFFVSPILLTKLLDMVFHSTPLLSNIIEGIVRLLVFVAYLWLINFVAEIRRVFAYHGAEHMTVHAYENNQPLTVESIRHFNKAHPRCGTAFLLVVMVVSIIAFALLGDPSIYWRIASRILLIPVITGISYEIIRWSGRNASSSWVRFVTGPSLALQSLTTQWPDDDQIEVAVAAMEHALEEDSNAE
tara:strand:+ start:208 stop:1137 length:930 start_codon:yes stop_codon:yes gene_type:complete